MQDRLHAILSFTDLDNIHCMKTRFRRETSDLFDVDVDRILNASAPPNGEVLRSEEKAELRRQLHHGESYGSDSV